MLNFNKIRKEKADLANKIKIVKEYKKAILNHVEKLNSKKRFGLLTSTQYESLINDFEGYHYKVWINHYDECIAYYNAQLQELEKQEKQSEVNRWNSTFYISSLVSVFWMFMVMSQLNITGFVSLVITTNTKTQFDLGNYNNTIFNTTGNFVQLNVGQTAGSYNSSVFENPDLKWNAISWKPLAPYGKELPNNQGRDTGYQDGNINMNGNVLLMHFDNITSRNENNGSFFNDSSGNNNHGSCLNCPVFNTSGKLAGAYEFNGNTTRIILDKSTNPRNITISDWVNIKGASSGNTHTLTSYGSTSLVVGSNRNIVIFSPNIDLSSVSSNIFTPFNLNEWHHIAVVYTYDFNESNGNGTFYVDGINRGSFISTNVSEGYNSRAIGAYSLSDNYWFNGSIDEVAIWNRTLSAGEILDIYKRGAARLKLQVRNCDDSKCSGENYIGPNGSTNDYYNDSVDSSSNPFFYVNVTNNPYFQYKAIFETDNATALPALSSTSLDYGYFDKSIASARVNFTVASTIVVRFNVSYVDFGNGSLVYAPNLTTINTSVSSTNPSTFKDPGPLVLQNDGNVDVNISIYSVTAANFIGGTNPTYEWNASENETGSCSGTSNLTAAITSFTATPTALCTNFTFQEANDALSIDLYLGLPPDVRPGYRETLVNVTAQRYCSVLPC